MNGASTSQDGFNYVQKAHEVLEEYEKRYDVHSKARPRIYKSDLVAREDVRPLWIYHQKKSSEDGPPPPPPHPEVLSVLRPEMGGVVAQAFPVNTDFRNRATMEIVAMHTELVRGVCSWDGVATCMISGNTGVHSNRDVGGLAEKYIGVDQAVLTAPGGKRQTWDMPSSQHLVAAHKQHSLLRLFRQYNKVETDEEDNKKTVPIYRYCGLYQIIDLWRNRVQFRDQEDSYEGNLTCFVKLKRVPGQLPLDPIPLEKISKERYDQLGCTVRAFEGHPKSLPEFCANCLMDGNGRNDGYECEGCESRLATNPPLPAACVKEKCSLRKMKCIHTVPSLICAECIDEKDAKMLKKDKNDELCWCCALCADYYADVSNLWGGRPHVTRGLFLKETELKDAIRLKQAAPGTGQPLQRSIEARHREIRPSDGCGHEQADEAGPSTNRQISKSNDGAGTSSKRKTVSEAGPSSKVAKRAAASEPRWRYGDEPRQQRQRTGPALQPQPEAAPQPEEEAEVDKELPKEYLPAPTEVQDEEGTEELEEDAAGGEEVGMPDAQAVAGIEHQAGGTHVSAATTTPATVASILAVLRECTAIGLDKKTLGRYLNYIRRLSAEEREIVYALAMAKDVEMLQALIDEKLLEIAS